MLLQKVKHVSSSQEVLIGNVSSAQPAVLLPRYSTISEVSQVFSYFKIGKKHPPRISEHQKVLPWQCWYWEDT